MIIDCHGHYTTAPPALQTFRDAQLAALEGGERLSTLEHVSDDELLESVQANQVRVLTERGADLMLFSPKASSMEHHVTDEPVAVAWARASNDLVHRVCALVPEHFAPVCQLPQVPPGGGTDAMIAELDRCVKDLDFVGCILNPDPSGGHWTSPPMTDPVWYPLYETLAELDVPAMIHVSASCNPNFHALGAHYLNADTTVFMQLVQHDLFALFPTLRFIIPHGGGAVPYHWGRYRGLATRLGRPDPAELLHNVFFDTCVYHQPGIDLLTGVIPTDNILFASEMLGAVRGADPKTGVAWDDTLTYLRAAVTNPDDWTQITERNARRIYPRLDQRLIAAGR